MRAKSLPALLLLLATVMPSAAADCAASGPPPQLTEYEQKAVRYVADGIRTAGSLEKFLAGQRPKEALVRGGFDLAKLDVSKVRAGVEQALAGSGCEVSLNRCAEFGACAIGIDLTEATGERLVRYNRQRDEDGRDLKRRPAPSFALKDLDGRTVSLADYRGKRVALVFWQSHCSHSMKSLPTWDALRRELAGKRFEVLTVLFNGGEAHEVRQWYDKTGHTLPVLLSPDETLAFAYDSHLVPTVFLIDERGRLVRKLVTEQPEEKLRKALEAFARG